MSFFTQLVELDLFSSFLCASGTPRNNEAKEMSNVLDSALNTMDQNIDVQLVAALLRYGLTLLVKFQCNRAAAAAFGERLGAIAWCFGDSYNGFLTLAAQKGIAIPKPLIIELENALFEWLSYCIRFTHEDFAAHLIYGTEPRQHFDRFNLEVEEIMGNICASFGLNVSDALPPCNPYFISCCLMPAIKKLSALDGKGKKSSKYLTTLDNVLVKRGAVVTDELRETVKQEMNVVRESVAGLVNEANEETMNKSYFMIKQIALREFWISKIHPKLSISQKKFSMLVQNFLSAHGASSVLAIDLANTFREAILGDLDNSGNIDAFAIAKIGRMLPYSETSFVEIVKMIADISVGSRIVQNLPQVDVSNEIFFDPNQERSICKVFNRVGWTAITGPKLSGKTCRLLHCAHIFPKEDKDFMWINFDGIKSEMEGICRVAQQLCFRKCHLIEDLELNLNKTLSSLKMGSVVVFDNMQLVEKRLNGVGSSTDNMTLLDCNEIGRQQVNSFFKRLLAICKIYGRNLSFIVVADDPGPLLSVVTFSEEIIIGPLHDADEYIASIQHTVAPLDVEALKIASMNLSGLIHTLAVSCSLRTIRNLAAAMTKNHCNDEAATILARCIAAKDTFLAMSNDERLLAGCLSSTWSYYDESLSWAMSREVLQNNLIRWKIAWKGLVQNGWIIHDADIGYKSSYLTSLVQPRSAVVSEQTLFDTYALHWTKELVRINDISGECHSVLEYFGEFSEHFSVVLELVFSRKDSITSQKSVSVFTQSLLALDQSVSMVDHALHASLQGISKGFGTFLGSSRTVTASTHTAESKGKKGRSTFGRISGLFKKKVNSKESTENPGTASGAQDALQEVEQRKMAELPRDIFDDSHHQTIIHHEELEFKASQKFATAVHTNLDEDEQTFSMQSVDEEKAFREKYVSPIEFLDCLRLSRRISTVSETTSLKIVQSLAGHLSNLLTYNVSPLAGKYIAQKVLDILLGVGDSSRISDAILDIAEQELRNSEVSEAIHRLQQSNMIAQIQLLKPNEKAPPYAARAMLVQGKLLQGSGDLIGARSAFSTSVDLYKSKGMSADNSWQCALAIQLHDSVCATLASNPLAGYSGIKLTSIAGEAAPVGTGSSHVAAITASNAKSTTETKSESKKKGLWLGK